MIWLWFLRFLTVVLTREATGSHAWVSIFDQSHNWKFLSIFVITLQIIVLETDFIIVIIIHTLQISPEIDFFFFSLQNFHIYVIFELFLWDILNVGAQKKVIRLISRKNLWN